MAKSIPLTGILLLIALSGCTYSPGYSPDPEPGDQKITPPRRDKNTYEVFGETYRTVDDSFGYLEMGVASWYGRKFHGRLTANGEVYDMYKMTAAHKTLPLPTWVRVTNLDNGQKIIVRINDRGPFHDNRLIDLSYKAARELGFADKGTAAVVVEALDARNYPDRVEQLKEEPAGPSYYLQSGAFSQESSAERLRDQIVDLLDRHDQFVEVKVLLSELDTGILHKVWVGPITSEEQEIKLETLITEHIGPPIKVTVE